MRTVNCVYVLVRLIVLLVCIVFICLFNALKHMLHVLTYEQVDNIYKHTTNILIPSNMEDANDKTHTNK